MTRAPGYLVGPPIWRAGQSARRMANLKTMKREPAWPGPARVRPGEGAAVHVQQRLVPVVGGTVLELLLRLGDAPVPDRRYPADLAWVDRNDGHVRLMFGQRRLSGDKLRSLVIVTMTCEAAERFLSTCLDFGPALQKYLHDSRTDSAELIALSDEPEQTVVLVANIVALAHSSNEATLDFYHASARAMHEAISQKADRIGVEPVVRVMLSGALLDAILTKCRAVTSGTKRLEVQS